MVKLGHFIYRNTSIQMKVKFTKMQGLGNDFVVIDAISQKIALTAEQIRLMADRHYGIGYDQLLLVERSTHQDIDFAYRIFNSDATESGQCINGARCFAKFVQTQGLTTKRDIIIATKASKLRAILNDDGQVTVMLGAPVFEPAAIPCLFERQATHYKLSVKNEELIVGAVSVGNPHVVIQVPSVSTAKVKEYGELITKHPKFPVGANVNFVEIVASKYIKLRVYERGTGETLACGSGACATVAIGVLWQLLADEVVVELCGGKLLVTWKERDILAVSGPAITVFEGEYLL